MDYRKHKKKLMEDPGFRKAYEALRAEYERRRQEIIAKRGEEDGIA